MKERHIKAKNVILFVGDGMDATTVTAARILKGQQKGNSGPEDSLLWDKFDYVALSKVWFTVDKLSTVAPHCTGPASNIIPPINIIKVVSLSHEWAFFYFKHWQ